MRSNHAMKEELKVNLSNQNLTTATLLTRLASEKNITDVNLEGNQITDASYLAGFSGLKRINLSCNPISSIEWVKNLSELEELDISNTNVMDLTPITRLSNLRVLVASSTKVTSIQPISACKKLEDVYLSDNALPNDFNPLCGLRFLKRLHLTNIKNLNPQLLLPLASILALEELELDDEYLGVKNYIMRQIADNKMAVIKHTDFLNKIGALRVTPTTTRPEQSVDDITQKISKIIEEITKIISEASDNTTREKLVALVLSKLINSFEEQMAASQAESPKV